jgi:hypothetical protein
MAWSDVEEYAAFVDEVIGAVRKAIAGGKTVDQAAASLTLPDRYKDYDMGNAATAIAALYAELKR